MSETNRGSKFPHRLISFKNNLSQHISSLLSAGNTPSLPQNLRKKELYFEALEPRLLLNADLPGVDLLITQNDFRDHDILVRMVEEVDQASSEGVKVNHLEVIDLSNDHAVLTTSQLDSIRALTLELGDGNDTVTIDVLSFNGLEIPDINLLAGDGRDELVIETFTATVWDITGNGAGTSSGAANVSYQGFEKLTGSSDNEDTFILHGSGSLVGGIDGGHAGFDVLEIRGDFTLVESTVHDASSGVIELDGKLIVYTGLEPITVDGTVTSLVLNTGDTDDSVLLEAGSAAGTFSLSSANGAFETHTFTNNVQSITLGLGTGDDSFISTLTDADKFLGNVTIAETVDLTLGNVTGIGGNFTVDTISGLHPADGTDLGWSGSTHLDYDGSSINITDYAVIDIDGDLSLTVNANTVLNASTIQEFISAPIVRGVMDVGDGVSINANNVVLAVITSGEREMFLGIDTAALIQLAIEDARVAVATDWTSMVFADQSDGTGTITRSGGDSDWISDRFAVDQDIQVIGATNASNQTYRILSVTEDVVTVDLSAGATMPSATETSPDEVTLAGYAFVRLSGDDLISFGIDDNDTPEEDDDSQLIVRGVPLENPDAVMTAAPQLTFIHSDTNPDTIVRSSGDWLADGFVAGQTIAVRDAGASNGNFTVADVTATTLTLAAGDAVTAAADVAAATVRGHTLGSFIYEGFQAGDEIVVQGSAGNDKTYTLTEVYDKSLVLSANDDIVAESIDLSSDSPADLLIQVVKTDLALEDTPLVLMDREGNTITNEIGEELSFTQEELDAAYNQNSVLWEDILTVLADNPILDTITGFGLKVWISDLTGKVDLGADSTITAGGDVSVTSSVSGAVEASTPSIVLGVSVVRSTVSSTVDIRTGAAINAAGAVDVYAHADNAMESDMSVTSGSIQNPLQNVGSGLLGALTDVENEDGEEVDPTGFADFVVPEAASSFLGPVGFIRVPGPSIAIALGMADTDSAVTVMDGSSIKAQSINIASANQYSYAVSASSVIFEPGANMGIGIAVAVSVTDSDSVTTIDGDLQTHGGSDGDISVSAESTVAYDEAEQPDGSFERSYSGGNSISAAAWVRNQPQDGSDSLTFLTSLSNKAAQYQDELRNLTAIGDLTNENPGKFELGAGISVLVSDNDAEVIISSTEDTQGVGGIKADGNLNIFTTAVEKPSVTAAACAESGGEIAAAGGIAFTRYDNNAKTTIRSKADLRAGGSMYLGANAWIPNNVTLDETFYGNYAAAQQQLEIDKAAAGDDPEKLAEAQITFNESIAAASAETLGFIFDLAVNRTWGLGSAEGSLLTSYVNSGAGGEYSSTATHEEVVFKKDGTTPKFNNDGSDKTKSVSNETQAAKYAIAGNVNILEIHNTGNVIIEKDVTAISQGTLDLESSADMDTINMTGLTSLWDISKSFVSRFTDNVSGGSDVSGSEGGVGASVGIRVFESVAGNKVYNGATLKSNADSVDLDAHTRQMHINITEMGTDGGSVGISGSIAVDVINTTTETLVDESAKIQAAADVKLNAHSDYLQVNAGLAGTEAEGGIAVGAAVGVNVLNSTTRAMVADLDDVIADNTAVIADASRANIQAGNDVSVTAKGEEVVVEVNLAGSNQKDKPGPTQDPGEHDLVWLTRVAKDQHERQQATRLGIAGAVNVDVSSATVKAEIGKGASVNAAGITTVSADQDRTSILVAGGGMLDQSSDGGKAAIAGAFDVTVFTRNVDALVNGAVIHSGSLDMDADRNDVMVVVTAGGAGSAKSDAAVAGSFNVNVFDDNVHAKITGSFVDAAGDVSVKARSDTLLVSVAGAVGVNLAGDAGVGAAFGVSHSDEEVYAYIDSSIVNADGDVIVHAHNELDVISVVASVGVSLEKTGIAGQLTLHLATNDVDARIGGGSSVTADNNVAVIADDQIGMVTITGGVAFGGDMAIGIAAVSTDIYDRYVKAHIDNGATVTANAENAPTTVGDVAVANASADGVLVKAVADDVIINIAVGASVSEDTSIQGSLVIDTNNTDVFAYIGSDEGASVKYATANALNSGDIIIDADYDYIGVNVVGGVSLSFGDLGVGASLNVSTHYREVKAEVGSYARLTADGSVLVDADLDATHVEAVFNAGLAKGTAGAGAVAVPVYNDFVTAAIRHHAVIRAGDDVAVTALHDFDHVMADVAVAAALNNFAGGISFGVVVQNDTVRALIGGHSDVLAEDTVLVEADSNATIGDAAGGVALGGKTGAGASTFLLVRNDNLLADISAGATVTGLAMGAGFTRAAPNGSTNHRGVSVVADSKEKIVGVAIQGSGGGTAGIAGAVPVSVITETTIANVQDGASINMGSGTASTNQDIHVTAADNLVMVNIAGNVAGGGTAAVGVSADIASVVKNTSASLGDVIGEDDAYNPADAGVTAQAKGNIFVEALAKDEIVSIAVGAAGAGNVAIGLNGGVYVLKLDANASIGRNATVTADGSVIVDALHDTEIDMIAASVAASRYASIVGSFDIPIVNKTVLATVWEGATVTGKGLLDGLNGIHTGDVMSVQSGTSLDLANPEDGTVSTPTDAINGGLDLTVPGLEQTQDGMFYGQDFEAKTMNGFKGVAVTATSLDDLQSVTGGLAIAINENLLAAAVALSLDVDVASIHTLSTIKDGVTINDPSIQAGNEQSVQVGAGSALDHLGVLASIAVSSGVGVALIGDVMALTTETKAVVGDADVYAKDDIFIQANAVEDLQSMVLSVAGGIAAIAPAVTVISLDATTTAALADGGKLDADGNIRIFAVDDTNIDAVDGGVAGGAAAISPGIGVMVIEKDTSAIIGANTEVNARALNNHPISFFSGEGVAAADVENAQGVMVEAWSREDIDQVVFGAAGGIVAIGGSAAVIEVDSDTVAGINGGAQINQDGEAHGDEQDVYVVAYNDLGLNVVSGGMGIGLVGAGVGVGVVTVNNDTSAYLNGTIHAEDDVSVAALSDQDLNGVIFGGAGGAGALAVAVGIFDIGGDQSDTSFTYKDGNGNTVSGSGSAAPAGANAQSTPIDPAEASKNSIGEGVITLTGTLTGANQSTGDPNLNQANTQSNAVGASAGSSVNAANPGSAAISFDDSIPAGTSAIVGQNAVITTKTGNVDVDARQDAKFTAIVGGAAIGGVAASGGVGVATLDNDVTGRISAGSNISAGGNISVDGSLVEHAQFTGFAGAGAIGVALSATVVSLTDTSDVIATLGGTIIRATDISVTASSNIGLYAETVQISIAAFGAAGGAATIVSADGQTTAGVLDNTVIGDLDNPVNADNLYVDALSIIKIADIDIGSADNGAMATGGSGGAHAVSVGYAQATDKRDTTSYIGEDVEIGISGQVIVNTDASSNLDVVTKGGSGGLFAAGLMFSNAKITESTTRAEIRTATSSQRTRISATDVIVKSRGDKVANSQTLVAAFGGVAIGGTKAETSVTATVDARIGDHVDVIAEDKIEVQSKSDVEGDAFAESVGGGVVAASGSEGKVVVTPTTTATVGDDTHLSAGSTIAVYTKSGQAEIIRDTTIVNELFQASGEIGIYQRDVVEPYDVILDDQGNPKYETLNLETGDIIQLHDSGAGSSPYTDRNLSVIAVDNKIVKVGSIIQGSDILEDRDTINFDTPHTYESGDIVSISEPTPLLFDKNSITYQDTRNDGSFLPNSIYIPDHNLRNGDQVVYQAGDLPVNGLVDGETYYVVVREGNENYKNYLQFSLVEPPEFPTYREWEWDDWNKALDEIVIDLGRWGDQDAVVTYTKIANFDSSQVRYANDASTQMGQPGNSIYSPGHGLLTGEKIAYDESDFPINGLEVGKEYYVINTDGDFIQFALSEYDALNSIVIDIEAAASELSIETYSQFYFTENDVNEANDIVRIPNHNFKLYDEVIYIKGDSPVASLNEAEVYTIQGLYEGGYVLLSNSSHSLQYLTKGNGSFATKPVSTSLELDESSIRLENSDLTGGAPANSVYLPGHQYMTGDAIAVDATSRLTFAGLDLGITYYMKVTGDYIQFAATQDNALNDVTLDLFHIQSQLTFRNDNSFDYGDIHFEANIIATENHGYVTGLEVSFDTGDVPFEGMEPGAYYVIALDDHHIQLAVSEVDALAGIAVDLQSFANPDNDIGKQSIVPLLDDGLEGTYRVIKIDDYAIKLQEIGVTSSDKLYLPETSFGDDWVNEYDPGKLFTNAFQDGEYITYYQYQLVESIKAVQFDLAPVPYIKPNGQPGIRYQYDDNLNTIYAYQHDYKTGDGVWYDEGKDGFINGTGYTGEGLTYFTVKVINENLIQLLRNGQVVTLSLPDNLSRLDDGTIVDENGNKAGLYDLGSLQADSDITGVYGLGHGEGYYVVDSDPNDGYIELSRTTGGDPIHFHAGNIGGKFIREGVNVFHAWGELELTTDLSGLYGRELSLLGPDGIDLNKVLADFGDSISNVTVRNSGGGLVSGTSSVGDLDMNVTLRTTLSGEMVSANGILVDSENKTFGKIDNRSFAVGLAGGTKVVSSDLNYIENQDVTITGDAVLDAGSSIQINAKTDPNLTTYSRGQGGGLVDANFTRAKTFSDITNSVVIDGNANISAENSVTVQAITEGLASNSVWTSNGGLLALNWANVGGDLKDWRTNYKTNTSVTIRGKSNITADEIRIEALNQNIDLDSKTELYMGGLFAGGGARSFVHADLTADITLGGTATLKGDEGIKIYALNQSNTADTDVYMDIIAIGGGDPYAEKTITTAARITAGSGATLFAGTDFDDNVALDVNADSNRFTGSRQFVINAIHTPHTSDSFTDSSTITWDADVHVASIDTGFGLLVDQDGVVQVANGVTVDGGEGLGHVVGDIFNVDAITGQPLEFGKIVIAADSNGTNKVAGGNGTFFYSASNSRLDIFNLSSKQMYLHDINIISKNIGSPGGDVQINANIRELEFGIQFEVGGADIDIYGVGDISVLGNIENRKGRTSITSSGGTIYDSGQSGKSDIRSHEVYLSAGKHINADVILVDDGTAPILQVDAGWIYASAQLNVQTWVIGGNSHTYNMPGIDINVGTTASVAVQSARTVADQSVTGGMIDVQARNSKGSHDIGSPQQSGLYSGHYQSGKVYVPSTALSSVSGGELGDHYSYTNFNADIDAYTINLTGVPAASSLQTLVYTVDEDPVLLPVENGTNIISQELADARYANFVANHNDVNVVTQKEYFFGTLVSTRYVLTGWDMGKEVSIFANTDINGFSNNGSINVTTNGRIGINETSGDLRVGRIESTEGGAITLQSDGGIVKALPGSNIVTEGALTLDAGDDIGSSGDFLVIEVGLLSHAEGENVFITSGTLTLRDVIARDNEVNLRASGDITGTATATAYWNPTGIAGVTSLVAGHNIKGNTINLTSDAGTVSGDGQSSSYMLIDSNLNASGLVELQAGQDLRVREVVGALNLKTAVAELGQVDLQVANNLDPLSSSLALVGNGVISAGTSIDIDVLQDVHFARFSSVDAGTTLNVVADSHNNAVREQLIFTVDKDSVLLPYVGGYDLLSMQYVISDQEAADRRNAFLSTHGNVSLQQVPYYDPVFTDTLVSVKYIYTGQTLPADATPDTGSNLLFEGSISTGEGAYIHGGDDVDSIHFRGTMADNDLRLSGEVTAFGHEGNDILKVTYMGDMEQPVESQVDGSIIGRDVLNLVSGEGIDKVDIFTHGSENSTEEYLINVVTGGADTLDIWGAEGDDIFLMRDTLGVASYPGAFNMVSVLNGTLGEATTSGGPGSAQRINVSTSQPAVGVHGQGGNDYFAVDSFVATTLDLEGDDDNDTFVFGQIFGSRRDAAAQVAALDKFDTTPFDAIEMSQSSEGIVNTNGGAGDNTYVVNANQGVLNLDGEEQFMITGAALMPGELNELPPAYDPNIVRPQGQNAHIVLTDTTEADVVSADVTYTAGDFDLKTVAFHGDLSSISVTGLDNAASLTWSLVEGALIGNDGKSDLLRLELASATILAGASGTVTVTAALTGALAHEDDVNVDSLSIKGIRLIATDTEGLFGISNVSLTVNDALPGIDVQGGGVSAGPNEVISGTWISAVGADGPGVYAVMVNGVSYALDEVIGISEDGIVLGNLTVGSDGKWNMAVTRQLWSAAGEISYDINFNVSLTDKDKDAAVAGAGFTIDVPDFVAAQGQDAVLHLTDNLATDSDAANLTFRAGTADLNSIVFDDDLGAIQVAGLDNAASLTWSLVQGALIGNDGTSDVIRLDVASGTILAGNSGTVTVTATLTGALAHEDSVNVNSLSITGIRLIGTDISGTEIHSAVSVIVADTLPVANILNDGVSGSSGDLLAGTWTADVGADVPGNYVVMIDGSTYGFGQGVGIVRDGRSLGTLTLSENGSWSMAVAEKLWNLGGDTSYDIGFGLTLKDADQDSVLATASVTIDVPAYVPATGEDASLGLTDTLTTDVDTDTPAFTAGSLDLVEFAFGSNFNFITVAGLDDAAAIAWSLTDGKLIGNDGASDLIRLTLDADKIPAGETAEITITATLMGALSHEDNVNVDSLTISGIELVATDEAGFELRQAVNVEVADTLPVVSSTAVDALAQHGETIIGTWSYDAAADGLGQLSLLVDDMAYGFDQAIEIIRPDNGIDRVVGTLTVESDGNWHLVARPDLWTFDGAAALYDIDVDIRIVDKDHDAAATHLDLAIEVPAVVFVEIGTGTVIVDEARITDAASIELAVKTGTFELSGVVFNADTSSIVVDGLDNLAALVWRLEGGALVGSDAEGDVLQLVLSYDTIPAGSDGKVTLTVTLLGALSHENDVNVDSLTISGIGLVATDGWGYTVNQSVTVAVLDDLPEINLTGDAETGKYKGAEVHTGNWTADFGADGAGHVTVLVNGVEYALGETIEVRYGDDYAGDLTVNADGTWIFVGQKKTYDENGLILDVLFTLQIEDEDGDVTSDDVSFTLTRKLGRGNNGVGNGEDPPPPGLPPENDTNGAVPGNPGNKGGADYDDGTLPGNKTSRKTASVADTITVSSFDVMGVGSQAVIVATAATPTPSTLNTNTDDPAQTWVFDDETGLFVDLDGQETAPGQLTVNGSQLLSLGEEWSVV